jgi:hypothetical protein
MPFLLGRRASCRPAEASGIAGLSDTERVGQDAAAVDRGA